MRKFPHRVEFALSALALAVSSVFLSASAGTAEPGGAAAAAPALVSAIAADSRIVTDPSIISDDGVLWSPSRKPESPLTVSLDPELECVAKVVVHEAGNQPRLGQLAVAQIIVNRARAGGRFPTTLCDVANQPGQFFNTSRYNPRRDTQQWRTAIEVATEALNGRADVTGGAYFYHAASQAPNRFFQSRQRVLTLGDHIFYR